MNFSCCDKVNPLRDIHDEPGVGRVSILTGWTDDDALRREVESLLAADDQARSSFLQSPPTVGLGKGVRIGDYEIQSLLGAGGMGEVYRARDLRLRREVAIKVLPAFVSTDPERLRRFEPEAMAAAALNHPNILAMYQMGTYEGAPYLVSELLEGETLREQIRRGRIGLRRAMEYAVPMARGLAAAHEKGIVHRDLKPENLFITKDGRVKIRAAASGVRGRGNRPPPRSGFCSSSGCPDGNAPFAGLVQGKTRTVRLRLPIETPSYVRDLVKPT